MPALQLTAAQTALLASIETAIEQAFSSGVVDNNSAPLIAALQLYSTLPDAQKTLVKAVFKATLCALMTSASFPGFTGTVSGGSVTFLGGIAESASGG